VRALLIAEARLVGRAAVTKGLMRERRNARSRVEAAEQELRSARSWLAEVEREIAETRAPGDLKKA
jgi:hypothetical protein